MIEDKNLAPFPIKVLLDLLYEEIKHGDAEHQKWLRDKMDEFIERYQIK
jgi:hypothetical protein